MSSGSTRVRRRSAAVLGFLTMILGGVAFADVPPVNFDPEGPLIRSISEYNLFKDPAKQIPNDGVVPYDLNTPLFSDYSEKHRFIWIPEGESATYDPVEAFDFPVGTIIVKTFGFLHDITDPSKGERIVETRLLVKKASGWLGLPYLWNEDVTEAKLAVVGARVDVSWTHFNGEERTIDYIVPNMNQCKQCHENSDVMMPIGPKARHLNRDYAYEDGTENQLTHLSRVGYLQGAPGDPDQAPRMAEFDDPSTGTLDQRARAWLDINCAHCHNPKGPAFTSGLDLLYHQEEPFRYGVMKPPVAAGRAGTRLYSIVPGKPDESILQQRIESVDPGVMMPQLPRRVVHDEGVALIREWITSMEPVGKAPAK